MRQPIAVHPFLIYSFLIYPLLIYFFLTLPGEPTPPMYTLAFVGDVMLGRGVAQALGGDWDTAFAAVQPWLAEADLAFANLESPLTTAQPLPSSPSLPPSTHDLRAPREAVAVLQVAGFDVVSLANNHALDGGEAGLQETVDALRTSGIASIGNWETGKLVDWDSAPTQNRSPIYQYTNLPTYRLLAFDDSTVPLDVDVAARTVAAAAEGAHLVVVSVHWGAEYQATPTLRQRAIARELAQAGADLIVGHGPHVPQRVEWVGQALVAYSLGNFLFDQPYPADCRWGAILRVIVRGDRIVALEALPTVAEQGRVKPADPQTAAAILARLQLPTSNP